MIVRGRSHPLGAGWSLALLILLLALLPAVRVGAAPPPPGSYPPRIILFIGDGMGEPHRRAARWLVFGEGGELAMDALSVSGMTSTSNVYGSTTDSAAAATALATGIKSYNGAISVDVDGVPLTTILERAQARGLAFGLVTTTQLAHATPGAFAAHVTSRSQMNEIARQMFEHRIDVMLGGGREQFEPLIADAQNAGYVFVENAAGLAAVDPLTTTHLLGLFAGGGMTRPYSPTLAQMTDRAIDVLSRDPEGFFLIVEGGQIDWAAHDNDTTRVIVNTLGFDEAVTVGRSYAAEAGNTLLIVTADHETGGMEVSTTDNGGEALQMPDGSPFYVNWTTTGHTNVDVPTTAEGPWSHLLTGTYENTAIHDVMRTALETPFRLTIEGPSKGMTLTTYTFTATVRPTTSLPFTLTWDTPESGPLTPTQGLSSTQAFSWTRPTSHTLTVTAWNRESALTATHTLYLTQRWFDIYLPLILRYNEYVSILPAR